ncbi:CD4+ T-cell-stimulating antigen [[Clostridium] ultunense Esp]|uniref:BMP family lipoprotein n=1 Tax=Thermicanus aegyptius TaxID=94009 RepID=UPI0002B70F96|nr:BMP family ABC transporter substrate-binding protein [Thermicanus aegyptius]CCQ98102.1 CD4+ T-cell-stimulating antigen [[Clostridium] ultunense Esp]
MKKWISALGILALVATLILAACGTSGNQGNQGASDQGQQGATNDQKPAEQKKTFKVGMVTDVGGVNDNSFNQSAWEGLQQFAKDTGAEVKYAQSTSDTDYIPNLNDFVKNGYDLTWGIGYLMADHVKQVAEQNPNAKLAIIDGVVEGPQNVESVTFSENEGSFLVGVVAGLMTKTNKIGFVGGMEIPVIKRFEAGFKAGVAAVNPKAEVIINYTGAFDKPDEGKAAAASIYDAGADIIFHASGKTGDGVFGEANDRLKNGKQVWVIGVDRDQRDLGPDITLTSMMKRVDVAVQTISKATMDGNFKGGVTTLGLKDNAVGLPADNPHVPKEVLDKVAEYQQKIIKGEITVPQE